MDTQKPYTQLRETQNSVLQQKKALQVDSEAPAQLVIGSHSEECVKGFPFLTSIFFSFFSFAFSFLKNKN
jgi:hypothetical protein